MRYRTCPFCGSHLDPGEVCDCREINEAAQQQPGTASGGTEELALTIAGSVTNFTVGIEGGSRNA